MKTKMIIALGLVLSLTSCYDFNREQAEKDAESKGKQILYEAEYSKSAKVEEAKADFESAKLSSETKQLVAEADSKVQIIKAEADAKTTMIGANATKEKTKLLIEAFGGVDNYLKFLTISGMNQVTNKIYIPTEASLPLIER